MDSIPRNSYYLEPGYLFFTKEPATIRTVVGGCVAVCVWDQVHQWGGMAHFIYPVTLDKNSSTPRYGNVAVTALIRLMKQAGSKPEDMVAHVLGGASPVTAKKEENTGHQGQRNVEVACSVLSHHNITIIGEDTGGHIGRKIAFDTNSGQIAVLKVQHLRKSDWLY